MAHFATGDGGGTALPSTPSGPGSTIAWAGITTLKDASGNAVTAFSAANPTSGFDYRQGYVSTVPLPPSAVLLASAMVAAATRRNRRRRT